MQLLGVDWVRLLNTEFEAMSDVQGIVYGYDGALRHTPTASMNEEKAPKAKEKTSLPPQNTLDFGVRE